MSLLSEKQKLLQKVKENQSLSQQDWIKKISSAKTLKDLENIKSNLNTEIFSITTLQLEQRRNEEMLRAYTNITNAKFNVNTICNIFRKGIINKNDFDETYYDFDSYIDYSLHAFYRLSIKSHGFLTINLTSRFDKLIQRQDVKEEIEAVFSNFNQIVLPLKILDKYVLCVLLIDQDKKEIVRIDCTKDKTLVTTNTKIRTEINNFIPEGYTIQRPQITKISPESPDSKEDKVLEIKNDKYDKPDQFKILWILNELYHIFVSNIDAVNLLDLYVKSYLLYCKENALQNKDNFIAYRSSSALFLNNHPIDIPLNSDDNFFKQFTNKHTLFDKDQQNDFKNNHTTERIDNKFQFPPRFRLYLDSTTQDYPRIKHIDLTSAWQNIILSESNIHIEYAPNINFFVYYHPDFLTMNKDIIEKGQKIINDRNTISGYHPIIATRELKITTIDELFQLLPGLLQKRLLSKYLPKTLTISSKGTEQTVQGTTQIISDSQKVDIKEKLKNELKKFNLSIEELFTYFRINFYPVLGGLTSNDLIKISTLFQEISKTEVISIPSFKKSQQLLVNEIFQYINFMKTNNLMNVTSANIMAIITRPNINLTYYLKNIAYSIIRTSIKTLNYKNYIVLIVVLLYYYFIGITRNLILTHVNNIIMLPTVITWLYEQPWMPNATIKLFVANTITEAIQGRPIRHSIKTIEKYVASVLDSSKTVGWKLPTRDLNIPLPIMPIKIKQVNLHKYAENFNPVIGLFIDKILDKIQGTEKEQYDILVELTFPLSIAITKLNNTITSLVKTKQNEFVNIIADLEEKRTFFQTQIDKINDKISKFQNPNEYPQITLKLPKEIPNIENLFVCIYTNDYVDFEKYMNCDFYPQKKFEQLNLTRSQVPAIGVASSSRPL